MELSVQEHLAVLIALLIVIVIAVLIVVCNATQHVQPIAISLALVAVQVGVLTLKE